MRSFMKKKTVLAIALFFMAQAALLWAQAARVWEEPLVIPTYLVEAPEPNPIFFQRPRLSGGQGAGLSLSFPRPADRQARRQDLQGRLSRESNTSSSASFRRSAAGSSPPSTRRTATISSTASTSSSRRSSACWAPGSRAASNGTSPTTTGRRPSWTSTTRSSRSATEAPPSGSARSSSAHRMKWLVGLTLRPGSSALEVTMKVLNRTPLAHSMLACANVADPRQSGLSGHLSARRRIRDVPRQEPVFPLAGLDRGFQQAGLHERGGRELVEKPRRADLVLRLGRAGRFSGRLRSRQGRRRRLRRATTISSPARSSGPGARETKAGSGRRS